MKDQEHDQKLMGQIITKAWNDESFKRRLLADAGTVLREEGVDIPEGLQVRVVENTEKLINIVIPVKPRASDVSGGNFLYGQLSECNCWQGEAWN